MNFYENNVSIEDSLEEFESRYLESCNLALSSICKRSKSTGCLTSHMKGADEQDLLSSYNITDDNESQRSSLSSPLLDDPSFSSFTFTGDNKELHNSFTSVPKSIHVFDEIPNTITLASMPTKHSYIPQFYDIPKYGRRHSCPNMKSMGKPSVKKVKKIPSPFSSSYGHKLRRKNTTSSKPNILSYTMLNRLHNTGTS